jgi:hypothetical protein
MVTLGGSARGRSLNVLLSLLGLKSTLVHILYRLIFLGC